MINLGLFSVLTQVLTYAVVMLTINTKTEVSYNE